MKIELSHGEAFYGEGSGDPQKDADAVVFIHGAGFDHSVWVLPARHFARQGLRVVAPDLPAHGRSQGDALTSIEAMADWVAELLSATIPAGVSTTIVGHSMGSLVTLALADRHRTKVDRIALLGTSAPMPVGPPLLQAAQDNHHAAYEMANTWSHSTQGRLGASQNPGLSNYYSGERWLERMGKDVYFSDLSACNAYEPSAQVLDIPALVVIGSEDKMTVARAGHSVADKISAEKTVVLAGAGHAMLSEQPNQVLDALRAFILKDNGS